MRGVSARTPGVVLGLSLALVCAGGGPGYAAPSPIPVVASTNVYGDLVRQVGGGRVAVVSIIRDPAQDPHSYEASTRTQLQLSRAQVVVENGGGYDEFVGRMLRSSDNSSAEVIDAVKVSGMEPNVAGEFNEHVWYDLPTMGRLADRIAQALGRVSPADADAFRKNAQVFKDELAGLEARTDRIEARRAGTSVAVTEPVPLYLTEACGLVNKTPAAFSEAVEEGDEVPPRVLRETLDLFTGRHVQALVYNEQTSGPQTEKVRKAAEENRIPVVPVTETLPQGKDYLGWMTDNITALDRALER
ncbi:zinc ABC transporter substrate-binding protein [Streptomyces sp. PCS3-D2]|uniref:metal ABC transporter solute-binding protein, Zn/Mn family n=1 Tax=Streptomyces sp. PCS3-D2 TaxID=1460244 RepID=UPI0004517E89|nr:zinc ABC transporter substrate-binding protein [Streptomyces sp. PCS3-D2]WKV71404.1 zinc ABC transporter substrate-binding protein [Streptomyces sp. PCS3-D2]